MLSLPSEAVQREPAPGNGRIDGRSAAWPPGALDRELASGAPGGHDDGPTPATAWKRCGAQSPLAGYCCSGGGSPESASSSTAPGTLGSACFCSQSFRASEISSSSRSERS